MLSTLPDNRENQKCSQWFELGIAKLASGEGRLTFLGQHWSNLV
jgi:hypothetical protein